MRHSVSSMEAALSVRSSYLLAEFIESRSVVVLEEMQEALGSVSRATVFRHLAKVRYRRSYNHNGRYYTKHEPARYDRHGLFSHKGIHFSLDGDLRSTVARLVGESVAGYVQRELQSLLKVRVQALLLAMIGDKQIARFKLGTQFVYFHPDSKIREAQLAKRREMLTEQATAREVTDTMVIEVLLVLIRYPGSRAGDVARRLKGHSPPITMSHVQVVFDRYDLDAVGEKGGPSRR